MAANIGKETCRACIALFMPRLHAGATRAEAAPLDSSAAACSACGLPRDLAGGQAAVEGGAGAAA